MRLEVDLDLCGGYGVCQARSPEIFNVVDLDGYAQVELLIERPRGELVAQARAAALLCPNRAIKIIEDDE